jgi:hypothetical protein
LFQNHRVCVRLVFSTFFWVFLTHHWTLPYYSPLFFLHQTEGERRYSVCVCVYLCAGVWPPPPPTHPFILFFF